MKPVLFVALPLLLSACTGYHSAQPLGAAAPPPSLMHSKISPQIALRPSNAVAYRDTTFKSYGVNPTLDTEEQAVSTFSVDVDTAAYTLSRAWLADGHLPNTAAVRVEEFVNAFDYGYQVSAVDSEHPFRVHAELFASPYRKGYQLLHIGLKAREVDHEQRQPMNMVLVIDTSGSMETGNRLQLVKQATQRLLQSLRADDRVVVVRYNQSAETVIGPLAGDQAEPVLEAVDSLQASGSTHVAAGLQLAWQWLAKLPSSGRNQQVLLFSDGVANTGITDAQSIVKDTQDGARKGIHLSTVGVGLGNYNDVLLEGLAQLAGGHYFYVNTTQQIDQLFSRQGQGLFEVVARDVKLQLEFDPAVVSRYRLLGYENRQLESQDFANDRVDAGEVGAGHSVTALYELKLTDSAGTGDRAGQTDSLGEFRIRYKSSDDQGSQLMTKTLKGLMPSAGFLQASASARLSAVVAAFAEKLRGSRWVRKVSYAELRSWFDGLPAAMRLGVEVGDLGIMMQQAQRFGEGARKYAVSSL